MAEPTLSNIFGLTAFQDASELIIQKADLAGVGLIADAANSAESLFMSIILNASNNLTEANRFSDPTNRNVTITPAGVDIFDDGVGNSYLRYVYSVAVYVPYVAPGFDVEDI